MLSLRFHSGSRPFSQKLLCCVLAAYLKGLYAASQTGRVSRLQWFDRHMAGPEALGGLHPAQSIWLLSVVAAGRHAAWCCRSPACMAPCMHPPMLLPHVSCPQCSCLCTAPKTTVYTCWPRASGGWVGASLLSMHHQRGCQSGRAGWGGVQGWCGVGGQDGCRVSLLTPPPGVLLQAS